ncbi:MAG: hypothetical protein KH366_00120 [Clostridiaceae bacterium]|nr:hypothetical protein [Clostridiaceae bacterium]
MKKQAMRFMSIAACAAMIMVSGCSGKQAETQTQTQAESQSGDQAQTDAKKETETKADTQDKQAVDYPKSSLTMIVPVAAGGNMDVIGRIAARYLEEEIGKPVVVENIKGSGGAVGATTYLAEDANTEKIIFLPSALFTVTPLYSETEYKLDDFTPIIGFNQAVSGVFAAAGSDIKTFEDLKNFDKNQTLLFGSGGIGVANYLFQCAVYEDLGLKYDTIPHSSGSEGLVNVIAGTTDVVLSSMAAAKQYVEDGSIVPLFVYSDQPYSYSNGVTAPPLSDFGIDAPYDTTQFFAIRSGTDDSIVDFLRTSIEHVYENEKFMEEYTAAGGELIPLKGDELKEQINSLQKTAEEIYNKISS